MIVIDEERSRGAIDLDAAIAAVEQAFLSFERGEAEVFPVTHGFGAQPGSSFSMKSGRVPPLGAVGLKVGSYWPANVARGLPSHDSTVLLLDPATGAARAIVATGHLNALRTAAADALAVRALARPDATTLGVIGAGHQAWFECLAVRRVRDIREVRVWNRLQARAEAFAARLAEDGVAARSVGCEEAASSDIVVTATAASEALVRPEWLQSGCHVSAMGADAPGKRELARPYPPAARLFADDVSQSRRIGEFQGLSQPIATLGALLAGTATGRNGPDDVTIFDSSGLAIQDLAIAATVLKALGY